MNVQMVRARSGWCPISSPGADLILLSRGMIQYHALHSLPRPNIQGAEDGAEGARGRGRKCKSRKRVGGGGAITDPLRPAAGQSRAALGPRPGPAPPARADRVFAMKLGRTKGRKGA